MPIDRNLALQELMRRGALTQEQAAQAGYQPPRDMAGMEMLGGGYKRAPTGQLFKEGRSGSMTRVAGPTDGGIDTATQSLGKINAALQALDRTDKAWRSVGSYGPMIKFDDNGAVLQQEVQNLGLMLKERPYNLGVLNGPDLMLIRQILNDPTEFKITSLPKNFNRTLKNLARILGDTYRNEAASFKATGGNPDALQKLYQATDSRYTPQQWGNQGLVPRNALDPSSMTPQTRKAAQPKSTKDMTNDDIKAALGL